MRFRSRSAATFSSIASTPAPPDSAEQHAHDSPGRCTGYSAGCGNQQRCGALGDIHGRPAQHLPRLSLGSAVRKLHNDSSAEYRVTPTLVRADSNQDLNRRADVEPASLIDFGLASGDPDLPSSTSAQCGTAESASYTSPGGLVSAGIWFASPDECGPYPSAAPAGASTTNMVAYTKAFDGAVTSAAGDVWLTSTNPANTFSPVLISPGQTVTIPVIITPSGPSGTLVTGTLYVDRYIGAVSPPAYGQISGDELAGLSYAYTIK